MLHQSRIDIHDTTSRIAGDDVKLAAKKKNEIPSPHIKTKRPTLNLMPINQFHQSNKVC